jgi:hypothetical protein
VIHQILEDEDEEEDEDDDDDDDEEDDEEDDEGEDDDDGEHDSRYDGSNATAEYAASGRSRCVVCNLTIAREAVRIIVSQRSYGYYEPSSRFIHPHCIRPFNEMVSARQRILPGRLNLRAISARDSITVRNHCWSTIWCIPRVSSLFCLTSEVLLRVPELYCPSNIHSTSID